MKNQELHPEVLNQIETANIPDVVNANMRSNTRKDWAVAVRSLLKQIGISHISVTTPVYSMAQSIHISTPRFYEWTGAHETRHAEIDDQERDNSEWIGYGNHCEYCKATAQAKRKLQAIILAAYPDLDDRSDMQSDHFNYCLSIN